MDELPEGQESGRCEYCMGLLPDGDGIKSSEGAGENRVLKFPKPETLLEDYG